MRINAIETSYKGYKFRSRLEARWAVFFDQIGWPYEYEPEGFEWHGERYLPDFICKLNDDVYFEIKPAVVNGDLEEHKDAVLQWLGFAHHFVTKDRSACLVFGTPWIDMTAYVAVWDDSHSCPTIHQEAFLGQCPCCTKPSLLMVFGDLKNEVWNAPNFNRRPYRKARSARFEYGETGS